MSWIKTSEQLPAHGQRVLCVCSGEDEPVLCKHLSEGTFKHFGAMGSTYLDQRDIPYWMPLPEIPDVDA